MVHWINNLLIEADERSFCILSLSSGVFRSGYYSKIIREVAENQTKPAMALPNYI
jgi:hypothetical protein